MDARLADLPLAAFAREQLSVRLDRLASEWEHGATATDPDSIHDLRVSLRRFGEALRVFKTLFPSTRRKQVRAGVRQVMRNAGATRDVDIVLEMFAAADIGLTPELRLHLENERAIAEASLRAVLAAGLATRFADRWRNTLALRASPSIIQIAAANFAPEGRGLWEPSTSTARNARAALPILLERFSKEGDRVVLHAGQPAKFHALRLTGKHFRYTLEVFRPVYGGRMDDLQSTLREAQSRLGDISDATQTIAWLKQQKLHHTPQAQQLELYLAHRVRNLISRFITYWDAVWGSTAFRTQWMNYLRRYAGQLPPGRGNRTADRGVVVVNAPGK